MRDDTINDSMSRGARALLVFGVHAVLIYAVAASLGIVEVPHLAKPMETVLISEPEHEATKIEPVAIKPTLTPPDVQLDVPEALPDIEVPAEETPIVAQVAPEAPASAAITTENLAVSRRVDPTYPPASRRLNEEGTVLVKVFVSEQGRPTSVELVRSSGFERLDAAALAAVRRWLFKPAIDGGVAVSTYTTVQVRFRLDA